MNAMVKLAMTEGIPAGKEYVFTDRTICTVGRADDCDLRIPNDLINMTVSRHHCVFDIDPPRVRVRDLGSRNGTYVNGISIGQRERSQFAEAVAEFAQPQFSLHDGDEVRVGDTVLRVEVINPKEELNRLREVPVVEEALAH